MIFGFKAGEARPHSGIGVLRDAVCVGFTFVVKRTTGVQQADVIGKVAVEHAHAAFVGAVVKAQGQIAGYGFFLGQIGVAHFIGTGGHVGAIGVQLIEGWRAFGVAQCGGQRPDRGEGEDCP